MRYKDISFLDFIVATFFRSVLLVFSVILAVVGITNTVKHPEEDVPFSAIIFVALLLTFSIYEIVKISADYWRQESEASDAK